MTRDTAPAAATLLPGYWCECATYPHPQPTPTSGRIVITASRATTPAQVIRWMRLSVRALAPSLGHDPPRSAWEWLTDGYADARTDLHEGQACAFTLTHANTRIEWTARPVLFLPTPRTNPLAPSPERDEAAPEHGQATLNSTE